MSLSILNFGDILGITGGKYFMTNSKTILNFFPIELLTRKIKKIKILELVTRFVTSQCVTRFCNSGIIDPHKAEFLTYYIYSWLFYNRTLHYSLEAF